VSPDHPVVITKFETNAKEIEIDAVADRGEIVLSAISEHVENAGVHSGDATLVLPPQKLYIETIRRIKRIARDIARALEITGPFNIQFLAQDNEVKVIECNLRASRSFPFVSKVVGTNFIREAARRMLGVATPRHQLRGARPRLRRRQGRAVLLLAPRRRRPHARRRDGLDGRGGLPRRRPPRGPAEGPAGDGFSHAEEGRTALPRARGGQVPLRA
jgi:hypothetical protein